MQSENSSVLRFLFVTGLCLACQRVYGHGLQNSCGQSVRFINGRDYWYTEVRFFSNHCTDSAWFNMDLAMSNGVTTAGDNCYLIVLVSIRLDSNGLILLAKISKWTTMYLAPLPSAKLEVPSQFVLWSGPFGLLAKVTLHLVHHYVRYFPRITLNHTHEMFLLLLTAEAFHLRVNFHRLKP
jgi:hypothetical protein